MQNKTKTKIYLWLESVRQITRSVKNFFVNFFRKQPVIFLIGTPEYGNLGDQLIALGEKKWLRDFFPDVPVREFTHEELMKDDHCRLLLSQICKRDVLFLQGGGNMNERQINCEKIRRIVIRKKPDNKIILFPQSVSYAQTDRGTQTKEETSNIYNAHPDLTVIAREETSFKNAKEMFPSLCVLQSPDMATYLFRALSPSDEMQRHGVLLCMRMDAEGFYSWDEKKNLIASLKEQYEVRLTDTNTHRCIPPARRLDFAQTFINAVARYRVMITDRFHGVIFSVLARTPCIVLRSCDHKIVDGVKWFDDLPGVLYAEKIEDVPDLVRQAYPMGEQASADFGAYFTELFHALHLDL